MQQRSYQTELVHQALESIKNNRNVMLCAITGSGKTEMAFSIIRQGKYKRVLFLVPGEVLLGQTASRAQKYGMEAACKWKTQTEWDHSINMMVVTPTTAFNRMEQGMLGSADLPDLVVVDEAHHCYTSANKRDKAPRSARLVKYMRENGVPTVGLSATVWRMSDKQGFDQVFDDIYYSPSIRELSDDGYLAPLELIVPSSDSERVHGGVVQNGEYTARGIEENNVSEIYTERAIQLMAERQVDNSGNKLLPTSWKQGIVYAVSIGHAVKLANILASYGVPTGFISSREPNENEEGELHESVEADRKDAVDRFRSGALRVVVNYAIVTEGFDLASAEIVTITRPTKSKALYRQMCGRAARAMDGKEKGIVIDCTDNWERFGGPMSRDHYVLEPRSKNKKSGQKTMFIYCNAKPSQIDGRSMGLCAAEIPNARSRECPACGESQGKICDRCNTWRRSDGMREMNDRMICGRCVKEELLWEQLQEAQREAAAQAESVNGSHPVKIDALREVYDQMKTTSNNPLSRYLMNADLGTVPPMSGMHGIKEQNGKWKPYFNYSNSEWKLGSKWYTNADDAMAALIVTLNTEIQKTVTNQAEVSTTEQKVAVTW